MIGRIRLVVGDTKPTLYCQLRDPDVELDISASNVVLKFKSEDDDVVLFQMQGELLPGTLQADLIRADMSQFPVPGSGGRVKFNFIQGNLNLPPGRYVGEIEVDYGLGNILTPYTRLGFDLREDF